MAGERIIPVILSGGSGTRLWPLSRTHYPKQLIPLVGEGSLLQQTVQRVVEPGLFERPVVVANHAHRFIVAEQLQQLGHAPSIILEPCGRNTAPAIAVAAALCTRSGGDPLLAVLPSDHFIPDAGAFHAAIGRAALAAADDYLVTFGITPQRPETGYGYIALGASLDGTGGAHRVARFVEKPDLETANRFLHSGRYLWNSGMFLFRAGTALREMAALCPEILRAAQEAADGVFEDLDFLRLPEAAFSRSPAQSFDRAVMEKTARAAVVPAQFGWNDLGAWHALWDVCGHDGDGNAVFGDAVLKDVKESYVRSENGRLVVAIGIEKMVVISTEDAVLVVPKEQTAAVGGMVRQLADAGRCEVAHHKEVFRPWGSYHDIDEESRFRVKRIVVKPGGRLSLQRHKQRSEHWVVVKGTAKITRGEEESLLQENQSTYIPKGVTHRLENPGAEPLHLIEVQVGDYLGEDDIERLDDGYGRHREAG